MKTTNAQQAPKSKTLPIVLAIVLVDMLGVGILIPIIPLLLSDPAYPYHLPLDPATGYLLLGLLTALYPFAMFLAAPILGQLSDTFGRKPVLALSLSVTAISYVLFGFGIIFRSIPLLFLARAVDGLAGGKVAVAQAVVADSTSSAQRVRYFGYMGAANGIGFILGPLIAALLSDNHLWHVLGAPIPFWFAAIISFLNMLAVILFLPETLTQKTKKYIRAWQGFENIREAVTAHGLRALYVTSFLFQSGFAFIITFFGVYLVSRFEFEQADIAYLFAFVGVLLAFTQLAITGPLAKRISSETITLVSLFVMSLSLFGVYFAENTLQLYILTIPVALCAGLIAANMTGLVSTSSKNKQQGSALGVNSSVQSLAQSIPPVFAGAIAAIFAPTTPVLFAAGIIGLAGIFFGITNSKGAFTFKPSPTNT